MKEKRKLGVRRAWKWINRLPSPLVEWFLHLILTTKEGNKALFSVYECWTWDSRWQSLSSYQSGTNWNSVSFPVRHTTQKSIDFQSVLTYPENFTDFSMNYNAYCLWGSVAFCWWILFLHLVMYLPLGSSYTAAWRFMSVNLYLKKIVLFLRVETISYTFL